MIVTLEIEVKMTVQLCDGFEVTLFWGRKIHVYCHRVMASMHQRSSELQIIDAKTVKKKRDCLQTRNRSYTRNLYKTMEIPKGD